MTLGSLGYWPARSPDLRSCIDCDLYDGVAELGYGLAPRTRVQQAGGLPALRVFGRPGEMRRQTKARHFAA